jgi:uncharacterized protein
MPRPKKFRKIHQPPGMKGFRPYGLPSCALKPLMLSFEEYESLRLVSYEKMSQEEAAKRMNVSRPTLTRIYNSAIETIAKAFVEGMGIEITGGSYQFEKDWYRCRKCHKLIEGLHRHVRCGNCRDFNQNELIKLNL